MPYKNETHFESRIRELINEHVTKHHEHIYALKNKTAVDIVVCKDGPRPKLFFIEVKYFKSPHGRLAFGSGKGRGLQPEILMKRPDYFEKNLRWIVASELHCPDKSLFLSSSTLVDYLSGGEVGEKYNNIHQRIFKEQDCLTERELKGQLVSWLTGSGATLRVRR